MISYSFTLQLPVPSSAHPNRVHSKTNDRTSLPRDCPSFLLSLAVKPLEYVMDPNVSITPLPKLSLKYPSLASLQTGKQKRAIHK